MGKLVKREKSRKMTVIGDTSDTDIGKFRKKWLKKGFDLVNITELCELRLGNSGWCNDWNEPDEQIYHVQIIYRREIVANLTPNGIFSIDEDRFLVFVTNEDDFMGSDFIIFMKVKSIDDV